MKKEIFQIIEIPEGIKVSIDGTKLTVKGPEGKESKIFNTPKFKIGKKENSIVVGTKNATKREKKLINTTVAHIKNMLRGVKEKFTYELKICSGHFPITVEIRGKEAVVKNFLGEKVPRKTKIPENVEIDINKNIIKISSTNKELAGQTAARLERTTRIRLRDRRIFQDGIFIINKAGKEI